MRRPSSLLAIAALLTSCLSGRGGVETFSDRIVVRDAKVAQMSPGPLWVSKAAWDAAEEHIVIADPASGTIYVVGLDGGIQRRIADERGDDFPQPNYVSRIRNQFLIATSTSGWLWFDRNLGAKSAWLLEWEEGAAPFSWIDVSEFDVSDTHLYAIGNGKDFEGGWSEKSVFAVSLRDRSVQQLATLAVDDDSKSYYNEPPFNLAFCGGKVWLLEMEPTVSIREARDGGVRLRSFPADFEKRPEAPVLVCASSVAPRRAALRNATVASGLFCLGDTLLLLAHRPRGDGTVQWLVVPIDPSRDTRALPIELPTTADEIVFVPGRRRWAVLEKGAMQHIAAQPLTRLITFARPDWKAQSMAPRQSTRASRRIPSRMSSSGMRE